MGQVTVMTRETSIELPVRCPNCAQPRAGVYDYVAIFKCGTMAVERNGELDMKAGPRCRRVVMRLEIKL